LGKGKASEAAEKLDLASDFEWRSRFRWDNCIVPAAALQTAEKLDLCISSFVSGYRFSNTVSPAKSDAPLGAGRRNSTFSANCLAAAGNSVSPLDHL
jgi:hypothetical protein